jgi:hypothetical protein
MAQDPLDILCIAHQCNQCGDVMELCTSSCPVFTLHSGPSLLCQRCLNIYDEHDSDELQDDEPDNVYTDMETFMEDFKVKAGHYATGPFRANAIEVFAKINDAIKLAHFMRKDNEDCYKKFFAEYSTSLFVKGNVCNHLLDKGIGEMAESWYRDEMLAWSFGEKHMFVTYISKLKIFRVLQEKQFADDIIFEQKLRSSKRKRKVDGRKVMDTTKRGKEEK